MPELGSHIAQLPGIQPSGCFEQDGLGVAESLTADLLGGPGDHPHVAMRDLTSGKRVGGAGQLAQTPRLAHTLPGRSPRDPALLAQPAGGARITLGDPALVAVEALQAP